MGSNYIAIDPIYYDEDDEWEIEEVLAAEAFPDWFDDDMEEPDWIPAWTESDVETIPWLQNGFVLVIVAFLIMIALSVGFNQTRSAVLPNEQIASAEGQGGQRPSSIEVNNPTAVSAPYDHYVITQGLHGQSYGQLAVDLAAGRGTPIKSPVSGIVTKFYLDEYGSTTLVIENEAYIVTLLHGDFEAVIGAEVKQGQVIGQEGNNGYTMDMMGNLCYGRVNCGNHTHLNIYDKHLQANVNPLGLIR